MAAFLDSDDQVHSKLQATPPLVMHPTKRKLLGGAFVLGSTIRHSFVCIVGLGFPSWAKKELYKLNDACYIALKRDLRKYLGGQAVMIADVIFQKNG